MEDIKMIQIINYIYIVGLNSRQNHVRDEVNSHFCIQQRLEGKGATSSRQSSSCGWTSSANIIFCRLYVGQILHCFNAWLACDLAMFTTFLNVHPASVQTSSRFESSKKNSRIFQIYKSQIWATKRDQLLIEIWPLEPSGDAAWKVV